MITDDKVFDRYHGKPANSRQLDGITVTLRYDKLRKVCVTRIPFKWTGPTYTWHSDSGHAWLEVPLSRIKMLKLQRKISQFSYVDPSEQVAYLEEDCDAQLFINVHRAVFGLTPRTIERPTVDGDHAIRQLDRYPAK